MHTQIAEGKKNMRASGIFTPVWLCPPTRVYWDNVFHDKVVLHWLRAAHLEGIPAQESELPKIRDNLRSGFGVRLSRLRTAGGLCTQTFVKKPDRYLNALLQDSRLHLSPYGVGVAFPPCLPVPPSCVSDLSLLTSRQCDACLNGTDKLAMQLGAPALNHLASLWSEIKTKDVGIKTILCQVTVTLYVLP